MEQYLKNMTFLKERMSVLYDIISKETSQYNLQINPVQTTYLNYQVKFNDTCCYLHSIYDIKNEVKNTLSKVGEDTKVLVLFGLGCGHILSEIKKLNHIERFFVIEPELNIIKHLMQDTDLSILFEGLKDLSLIINKKKEDIPRYLYQELSPYFGSEKIEIIYNVSYRGLFQGYYEYMYENLIRLVRVKKVNLVTHKANLFPQIVNNLKNLYIPNIPIEEVAAYINDVPIIIVSAGPSLNKNIHLLKEVKDRAIIVAVGTAIKVLDSYNIIPHFRAACDGNEANVQLFNELNTEESILLYTNTLFTGTVKDYKGTKVNMLSGTEKLTHYVYNEIGYERVNCDTGFSIATLVLDLFLRLGSPEVIFMGQDCSFSEKMYAEGAERDHYKYKNVIKEKDIYGNEVYSLPVYTVIKDAIQFRIQKFTKTKYYNATEGGLNIDGAENIRFQDVLSRLDNNVNVKEKLTKAFKDFDENKILDQNKQIRKVMEHIEDEIEKNLSLCYKMLKELAKIKKLSESKSKNSKIVYKLSNLEFEKKLLQNNFYKEVIYNKLESFLSELKPKFSTDSLDEEELEALQKYKLGLATESIEYLKFIQQNFKI